MVCEIADPSWWKKAKEAEDFVTPEICPYAPFCDTIMGFDEFRNFCLSNDWIHCSDLPKSIKTDKYFKYFKPVKEWVAQFKEGRKNG